MQVDVNGRYLVQQTTGQQRYAREIVARLEDRMRVIRPSGEPKGFRGHLWEQFALPRRLGRELLWSPSATGPLSVRRQVVTIHDCAFIDHAECFSRAFAAWYQYLVPRLARRVARVITVSEFSRQQIVRYCRVPEDKVTVIYSGVSAKFRPHCDEEVAVVRSALDLPSRYVVCVGSLEPRKNLRRLLAAWQQAQPQLGDLELVLVGAQGKVFADAGLNELPPATRMLGYLSDEQLPAVMAGAEFFVYPSIYEGFGLPVIEAFACGVPVLTARISALPEVAGDAALYVDPLSVESIASGIAQLATDAKLRADLIERGLQRVPRFSWEQTAAETWQVLEEAA